MERSTGDSDSLMLMEEDVSLIFSNSCASFEFRNENIIISEVEDDDSLIFVEEYGETASLAKTSKINLVDAKTQDNYDKSGEIDMIPATPTQLEFPPFCSTPNYSSHHETVQIVA